MARAYMYDTGDPIQGFVSQELEKASEDAASLDGGAGVVPSYRTMDGVLMLAPIGVDMVEDSDGKHPVWRVYVAD